MKYKIGCSEYPETQIEFDGLEPLDLMNALTKMYLFDCIKPYKENLLRGMFKDLSNIFKDRFENYFWAMTPIAKSVANKEINYGNYFRQMKTLLEYVSNKEELLSGCFSKIKNYANI